MRGNAVEKQRRKLKLVCSASFSQTAHTMITEARTPRKPGAWGARAIAHHGNLTDKAPHV